MTPADVLENAADLIDEVGHYQGNKGSGNSECAVTACYQVCRSSTDANRELADEALNRLRHYIGRTGIVAWNDSSNQATVTATMRQVAAELRQAEVR